MGAPGRLFDMPVPWLCHRPALQASRQYLDGLGECICLYLEPVHALLHRGRRAGRTPGPQVLASGSSAIGVLELLAWRSIGGLWLMLIGWFLVTTARAEQQSDAAREALAGLLVRDIMLPHPDIGAAWSDVAEFTGRVILSSRQTVFPILSLGGDLAGVVYAEALARVPDADRGTTRLGQIAAPVPPAYLADPGSPASSLLSRPPLRGQLLAVVVEDRRVTGLVTTEELRLALRHARLRTSQPAGNGW